MPKISVIVPVYNVAKYLERCLESILSQSFKDFEIICVNDGSTDNSLEILQQYIFDIEALVNVSVLKLLTRKILVPVTVEISVLTLP